jgi:hypothetical protein
MRLALRGLVTAAAALVVSVQSGSAQESFVHERFCTRNTAGEQGGPMDCSFKTWQQCIESARGLGRFCMEDPFWRPPRQEPKTQGRADGAMTSEYPPAEPGALVWEPLKAAYPGGFDAVSHLLRGMPQTVPKLTMLITCVSGCTSICRGVIFASLSIDGAPFRVLGGPRIQSFIDGPGIRPREMSNFCCLPGRAGGTPIMV